MIYKFDVRNLVRADCRFALESSRCDLWEETTDKV
jgi:hypothetical protein